jgi:uncharacterized protein YdaU (DUF1376 family)
LSGAETDPPREIEASSSGVPSDPDKERTDAKLVNNFDLSLATNVILFEVWQNVFADYSNKPSTRILTHCAAWLSDIERRRHSRLSRDEEHTPSPWSGLNSNLNDLEKSLRRLLLRGARVKPQLVAAYFEELRADGDRLDQVFEDIAAFSPILSRTHATALVDLTLLHLKEELPQARLEKEREKQRISAARRAAARGKSADERTRDEEMEASGMFLSLGSSFNSYEWDNLAIDKDTTNYFPASPQREPFHSLFEAAPTEALRLVKDLTNHAITAWRQLFRIDPQRRATPIPVMLEFPWGRQIFWGTNREYLWARGMWAPYPLAGAYLALESWAFKQLDGMRCVFPP